MLVTDRKQCGERPLAEVVDEAIHGGVNVVQLREKDLPASELYAVARQLRGVCGSRALLLINDRVDVALISGADGVHLGERSVPVAAARKLLPPSMLVGRSVHSVNAAREAEQDGADYVLVGTVFASPSHPEVEPAGVGMLESVRSRIGIPVLGIGGITPENVGGCWQAGADGVAVQSAILRADDPRRVATLLAPAGEEAPCD
jgi:thiamine-phosphate pyrophosphorylase